MNTTPRSRMFYSRLIGFLFLAGFLFYGTGFALVSTVVDAPDFISSVPTAENVLVLGVFLMLLNTVVDVGKGVLFFPILENHGKRTALVYLVALVVQVVLMDVGAILLLMLVPLGQLSGGVGADAAWVAGVASLLVDSNTMAYNTGQAVLSFGGIFLCALLLRTRLIPALLAGLGLGGYVLHAAGSAAEIFGIHISTVLLIPGALFEVGLAFWLIARGFAPEPSARGNVDQEQHSLAYRAP